MPLVVSILSKKYAKLLGEYEFAERLTEDAVGLDAIIEATNRCDLRKKDLDEKLSAIETVIWLFDPDWDPAKVRPTYPRKQHVTKGAISRTVYAILRDATVPLSRRELARMVAARLRIEPPDEREISRIESDIHLTLKGREGRTAQVVSYKPMRWVAIPKEQARAGRNRQSKPNAKIGIVLPNPAARMRLKRPPNAPQAPSETGQSQPSSDLPYASR
ncbi:MAG: hypothetical protein WDN01_05680 [Rhizomicrobium sp.]